MRLEYIYRALAACLLLGLLLFYSMLTSGCNAQKRATKHMVKAWQLSPEIAVKYCRQVAPITEVTKDSIVYLQGETITETDTLTINCDSPKVVKVPFVKTIRKTDTIYVGKTITKVDDVLLKLEQDKNKSLSITNEYLSKHNKTYLRYLAACIGLIFSLSLFIIKR